MNEVRILMENYWIDRVKDKETYAQVRREKIQYHRFVVEQLGWRLIDNERILKIEKIPVHAEAYMGITEFKEIDDYCFFCALLIFLEDKEDSEQFLLSELVDMVEIQMKSFIEIDWTRFNQRKALIRVLQYAEKMGLIDLYEGSSEQLTQGIEHEILYENTGLSRYFATNFNIDISGFETYKDFEAQQPDEIDRDRGFSRINRVYRQLVTAPAMYWQKNDDPDALYVRNQRPWVDKTLQEFLGGKLHLHKNAAFLVMDRENNFGDKHPGNSACSEIVVLICAEIRKKAKKEIFSRNENDCIVVSRETFKKLLKECKEKYGCGWSKEYREMAFDKLVRTISSYMEGWMLLKEKDETVIIYPCAGKITGFYPKDFALGEDKINE